MNPLLSSTTRQTAGSLALHRLSTEVECLRVQAMLQSGPDVPIADEECDLIARHVEVCGECRDFLDVVCPASRPGAPQTTGNFSDRLEEEVISRLRESRGSVMRALTMSPSPEPLSGGEAQLTSLVSQLAPGRTLNGLCAKFRIKSRIGCGDFTETYDAEVLDAAEGKLPDRAVVKIPRLSSDMSDDAAIKRLRLLNSLIEAQAEELKMASPGDDVARVLDRGEYVHRLRSRSTDSTFVAYEFVPGCDLADYMSSHHASSQSTFGGLSTAAEFARWARMLTQALSALHNRLIIHGDINPRNILVREGKPVFIDCGQSLFREVMKGVEEFSEYFYRAPEGVTTPASDLFSLGGVLYFLATGKKPIGFADCLDNEVLKRLVALKIKNANPELYRDDAGVVDVIAMCLRKTGRVQHAGHLLRDIDTFWPETPPTRIEKELEDLRDDAKALDATGNSLYRSILGVQVRSVRRLVTDMTNGVFDISGSSNDIRSAAFSLISTLGRGDSFYGLSLPVFWAPENIGINGRFLSMTRNAAARGALVKRVFLLEEGLGDKHLHQIVAAQLNAMADVDESARSNYSVRYVVMSAETRRQLVAAGKHFGLLVKAGDQISMSPVYGENDLLVTLRFRSGPRDVEGLHETFDSVWSYARPLVDLSLPSAVVGMDTCEKAAG